MLEVDLPVPVQPVDVPPELTVPEQVVVFVETQVRVTGVPAVTEFDEAVKEVMVGVWVVSPGIVSPASSFK